MWAKKRDDPILKDFTPYDPFEAGRIMVRVKRIRFAVLSAFVIVAITVFFLAIVYIWPGL
jgi:hypothetical protein